MVTELNASVKISSFLQLHANIKGLGLSAIALNSRSEQGSISSLPDTETVGATANSGAETGDIDVHGPDIEFFDRSVSFLIAIESPGEMVAPGPRKMFNKSSAPQTHVASSFNAARRGRISGSKIYSQSPNPGLRFPMSVFWLKETLIDVPIALKVALNMDGAL